MSAREIDCQGNCWGGDCCASPRRFAVMVSGYGTFTVRRVGSYWHRQPVQRPVIEVRVNLPRRFGCTAEHADSVARVLTGMVVTS